MKCMDLERLKQLHLSASPIPWDQTGDFVARWIGQEGVWNERVQSEEDAELIVLLRNFVPELIVMLEKIENEKPFLYKGDLLKTIFFYMFRLSDEELKTVHEKLSKIINNLDREQK